MRPHAFLIALTLLPACKPPPIVATTDAGLDAAALPVPRDASSDSDGPGFAFTVSDAAEAPPPPPARMDCAAAAAQRGNAGCSFYAIPFNEPNYDGCFAMYVVNPGDDPIKLQLQHAGKSFSMAQVARLPRGAGHALTYAPFDEKVGLPARDVAIVFLAAGIEGIKCPRGVQAAVTEIAGAPITEAFHLVSDRPVIGYQILPYGGAGSAVTSSTLLLPEEAWGTAYVVPMPRVRFSLLAVVAGQDGTEVTFRPPGASPVTVSLRAGAMATLPDGPGITGPPSGTTVFASKPVAVVGAMRSGYLPGDTGKDICCADSAHQQIPPVSAWGNEYVAVRHRTRAPTEEPGLWQLVGAVGGTTLSYTPATPAGAPLTLSAGQAVEFLTSEPFVVRSQDTKHPFFVGSFMTSSSFPFPPGMGGNFGDPEFVNVVPTAQYGPAYTFFTDPTYPDTNLVLVRKRGEDGQFADVTLACAMKPLGGWTPLGDYQFLRVDLVTGNFKPAIAGCDNGRHAISSAAPFAVTVWGWGSGSVDYNGESTADVSYGYTAGAGLRRVNDVTLIP